MTRIFQNGKSLLEFFTTDRFSVCGHYFTMATRTPTLQNKRKALKLSSRYLYYLYTQNFPLLINLPVSIPHAANFRIFGFGG